jgi:hypothetical protein
MVLRIMNLSGKPVDNEGLLEVFDGSSVGAFTTLFHATSDLSGCELEKYSCVLGPMNDCTETHLCLCCLCPHWWCYHLFEHVKDVQHIIDDACLVINKILPSK